MTGADPAKATISGKGGIFLFAIRKKYFLYLWFYKYSNFVRIIVIGGFSENEPKWSGITNCQLNEFQENNSKVGDVLVNIVSRLRDKADGRLRSAEQIEVMYSISAGE